MNEKTTVDIRQLSETLFIPLWAKGVEYGRKNALIDDVHAKRMMDRLDYNFDAFHNARMSQIGCCVRAKIIDDMTARFIAAHPDAVVVQLGAGLDARYERLGTPAVTWYDLDLPDVIALRRELLPESGNHYLAQSLFDEHWMEMLGTKNRPVLLILEGVLMYFPQKKVEALLAATAWHCRQVDMIFDIVPPFFVGKAKQHDALKGMKENVPEFLWSASGEDIAAWHPGWQIREEAHLSRHSRGRFPWFYRLLMRLPAISRRFDSRIVHIGRGFGDGESAS